MRLLVTGATGMIGSALVDRIKSLNYDLCASVRSVNNDSPLNIKKVYKNLIGSDTDWGNTLDGVDVIVHTAGLAHNLGASSQTNQHEYMDVNYLGTLKLAEAAARSKVRRFIFISTIKVNGESTKPGEPFNENDIPRPYGPYAISKYKAEIGLRNISKNTNMEFVIIRPPLVYGPGVKANFYRLMRLVRSGIPLPLGNIKNKRSYIALDNLIEFIILCFDHKQALNQLFVISDGNDLSTTELIKCLSSAMNKKTTLIPFPYYLIKLAEILNIENKSVNRLHSSLLIDPQKAMQTLNWTPVISVNDGIKKTTDWFLNQ